MKPIYPAHLCAQVWNERITKSCDGLIFMKLLHPYTIFRSSTSSVFKWKPKILITIDFLVKRRCKDDTLDFTKGVPIIYKVRNGNSGLYVCTTSGRLILLSFAYLKEDGIWEFSWTGTIWTPYKCRRDKKNPNTIETAVKTIRSIEDAISVDELFSTCKTG